MTFEDIEDKIIAEIKDNVTYVKTIETYAGQLEQNIKQLTIPLPAAFIVYGGSTFTWIDGPNHNEEVVFSVLVASKNVRGEKRARKAAYGCYQMINDVLVVLTNQTFDLQIEKLVPIRTSLVHVSKTIVIYGIDFKTNFDTTFNE